MAQDISIAEVLSGEGFDNRVALQLAREVLVNNGLTNWSKVNIHSSKRERIRNVLSAGLYRTCDDPICRCVAGLEAGARRIVVVSPANCEVCGGKKSRRVMEIANMVFQRKGISRIVVVGGTRVDHEEISRQARGKGVEFRFVDGTKPARASRLCDPYSQWADLVIIWANTPLKHVVSYTYTGNRSTSGKVVYANRTGVAAMIDQVLRQIA